MKTIAIIAACDTKGQEVSFLVEQFESLALETMVIDVSISVDYISSSDVTREQVALAAGVDWEKTKSMQKNELLDIVAKGVESLVPELYKSRKIQGVISIGGLQNTLVGTRAMRALPIGVPKLMVSTVASGNRPFDFIVGTSDIMTMPSIVDFTGVNIISSSILRNAAAAIAGMAEYAGREPVKTDRCVIGTTLMGATNDGVVQAVDSLAKQGYEVLSFHSTGVGGQVMENLINEGIITASMDLTLHEIVYEYFGFGFGKGTKDRLMKAVEKGIPMVVCPGGIDFICMAPDELFSDIDNRKYIWHNSSLAHVKLNKKEVEDISRIIVSRLNQAKGNVVVVLPKQGLRSFTRPGEALFDLDVEQTIFKVFESELREDIPLKYIDANFMDKSFSSFVANEMITLIQKEVK